MSQCNCDDTNCRTCKPTAHDMYIEFLDRVITIGKNNDNNDKNSGADKQDIKEKSSSASVGKSVLFYAFAHSYYVCLICVNLNNCQK